MARRKNAIEPTPAYWTNPDIVFIDLSLNGQPVPPGTRVKIKHDKQVYTLVRMCYNQRLHREWVDLRSSNGDWRSVYPDKLRGIFNAKKSRAKRK